jgi:ribosomal protein L37E
MNNADWWAKKLGTPPTPTPVGRPSPTPIALPSQQPLAPMPSFQQTQQGRTLPSSSQVAACPDCGSANYMSVANAKARCFDCGYPTEQSGSRYGSLAGAHVEGAAKPASGNDTANNWNPQGIIGRIDG